MWLESEYRAWSQYPVDSPTSDIERQFHLRRYFHLTLLPEESAAVAYNSWLFVARPI